MDSILLFQDGLVLFINRYFIETERALLVLLVLLAAAWDIRTRRIPNLLVLFGLLSALGFHALSLHGLGLATAFGGLVLGLALFMPLYLLRAMGAGDVKLMGMVGAFLGTASAAGAVCTVLIAGGVLALAAALCNGRLQILARNLRYMMMHALAGAATGQHGGSQVLAMSAGQLPYGVAIAAGTIAHLFLLRAGHALMA